MRQNGKRLSGIAALCILSGIAVVGCDAKDSAVPAGEAAKITAPANSAAMQAAKQEDAAAAAQFEASKGSYSQGVKPALR
jgi:hypothetical protein